MISRIKGTHDVLDVKLFNFIIDQAKHLLQCYHFSEIITPILEATELYKRSLGLETDIVTKEMFTLATQDQETICLRPEATAATMRAFLEHSIQTRPWKVFSWGPMFRHERPQKGRYRQFNQISIEIIGSKAVAHDVQCIAMLDHFFSKLLKIDSYALIINFLGCFEDRQRFKPILYKFLTTIQDQLCPQCLMRKEKNIMRVFDCKTPTCQILYRQAPRMTDHLCSVCTIEWQQVQDQLTLLSVSYSYNPHLVRGLDYYDKTVFEFVSDNLGSQTAFCSGGRYDSLAQQLGSTQEVPGVGAAIGVERLLLLLEQHKDQLILPEEPSLQVIIPLSADQQSLALLVADELYAAGLSTEVLLENDSIKSMLRKANKMGARFALLLGSDEQAAREVTVKNMITGTEEKIKQVDVVTYLKK